MKRTFLALSLLALALVVVLIAGAGLGAAQTSGPVENARPTPTPLVPVPDRAPEVPEGPEIPPLPDLVVTRIEVSPSRPVKDQVVTIRVTIKNQADYDVPLGYNFWSDLYVDPAVVPIRLGQDGVAEWPCQATWVPAGGSHVLETEYLFDEVKTYSLYAQVDTDGHVLEANEANNVLGPVVVRVRATNEIVHQTHEQFQLGMASSLDVSHPQGVIRPGIFVEPEVEPDVYSPDFAINDPTAVETDTGLSQIKPALTSDGSGTQFVAWEDGRWGGLFNRRIYFRRSTDGENWVGETLVDTDPAVDPPSTSLNQVSPDLIYDPGSGRLYAVWQDDRNGDYDIYFAYSADNGATWLPANKIKLNDDVGSANQMNPSLAVGPAGEVYAVWQDQRNGNDDVYIRRSDNGGVSWGPNYFVTDDPDMTAQNQVAPSVAVEQEFGIVYVGWEDWRNPAHPEVYVMWSWDQGETFGVDIPVVHPPAKSHRVRPTLKAQTTGELVEVWNPATGMTETVSTAVSVVHVAWQEGTDDSSDVYYSYAPYVHYEPDACPWPYDFCFATPQKVSGFVIDSDYALSDEDTSYWPIEPSWQGQVSLDFVPDNLYWTYCHADSTQVYSKGVIIAWSDARSYDDWRYEIRTRRVASPEGDPKIFEVCEDWAVGMVNSNAKLYALRDDPDLYDVYKPAATGQANPSISVDESGIYVAWDDDRWDDPSIQGRVRNRDVFSSRMDLPNPPEYRDGIYISPVIDGGLDAPKWYVLSWFGATQHNSDLLFQTRFGNNRNPPKDGVAGNGWTAWTGNPSSPAAVGCSAGVGCYYDAPGRRIVRPDGSDWFSDPGGDQYRYIQYKVKMEYWARFCGTECLGHGVSRLTALSQVKIHYEGAATTVFLPIVLRNY